MLADIAKSLASAGLSVENISTDLQRRGKTGQIDFVVTADCVTTTHMEKQELDDMVHDLESLRTTLELDVVDIRVQRLLVSDE